MARLHILIDNCRFMAVDIICIRSILYIPFQRSVGNSNALCRPVVGEPLVNSLPLTEQGLPQGLSQYKAQVPGESLLLMNMEFTRGSPTRWPQSFNCVYIKGGVPGDLPNISMKAECIKLRSPLAIYHRTTI